MTSILTKIRLTIVCTVWAAPCCLGEVQRMLLLLESAGRWLYAGDDVFCDELIIGDDKAIGLALVAVADAQWFSHHRCGFFLFNYQSDWFVDVAHTATAFDGYAGGGTTGCGRAREMMRPCDGRMVISELPLDWKAFDMAVHPYAQHAVLVRLLMAAQ